MKRFLPIICLVLSACSSSDVAEPEDTVLQEPWIDTVLSEQARQLAALSSLARDQAYTDILLRLRRDIDPEVFATSPLPPDIAADHLYRARAIQLAAIGLTGLGYDARAALGYDMGAAALRYGSDMRWQDKILLSEVVVIEGRDGTRLKLFDEEVTLPARAPATGCVRYRSPSYRSFKIALDIPPSPGLLTPDCIGASSPSASPALTAASESPPSLQAVLNEAARIRSALMPETPPIIAVPLPTPEPLGGSWRVDEMRTATDRFDMQTQQPPMRASVTGPDMIVQSGCVSWLFRIDRTKRSPRFIPETMKDANGDPVPMCTRGLTPAEGAVNEAFAQVNTVLIDQEAGRQSARLIGPEAVIELRR